MKVYEFYWSWYEEFCPLLFSNKEDKTEIEWELDCKRAIKECGEEYLKQEKSWAGANNWIEFSTHKLIEYGYERVVPITFGHFGSYIIEHYDDIDDDDIKWKEIIGDELFRKTIEHNKELNERLYNK